MTARALVVLRRVVDRIREVAPEGLGGWPPAWDIVAGPSDLLLDALADWERSDSAETRQALQVAANDFVRAWREAARRWDSYGRSVRAHRELVG